MRSRSIRHRRFAASLAPSVVVQQQRIDGKRPVVSIPAHRPLSIPEKQGSKDRRAATIKAIELHRGHVHWQACGDGQLVLPKLNTLAMLGIGYVQAEMDLVGHRACGREPGNMLTSSALKSLEPTINVLMYLSETFGSLCIMKLV
jgi:hypothetical protein